MRNPESLTTVPNLLSLVRVPLAVPLGCAIHERAWWAACAVLIIGMITDALDGWWARRFAQTSRVGRSLDPLTDKVLICSGLIFLQSAEVGVAAWMVAAIIGREMWITGLRGIVEAAGMAFGADRFGKLKTVLQSLAVAVILVAQALPDSTLDKAGRGLLLAAVIVTLGSGLSYTVRAMRLLNGPAR
jgi:CDP-diacylglycerol---glycerol-3-phosphate 3-phosphatidyltransferase